MAAQRRALFVQYTNPGGYPPLQHVAQSLLDSGWHIVFLGVAGGGAAALSLHEHSHQDVLRMPACSPGWRQKLHYATFLMWVAWWRLAWRPHCVYASDPLSAPAALLASALPLKCLVYHEHDAPPTSGSRFMRWVLWCRARLARRARVVVVPNAKRGERLMAETAMDRSRLFCVWNCPTIAEAQPEPAQSDPDSMWLLYHGSIASDKLPLTLLEAMARGPEAVKLRIIGYETAGGQGYVGQIRQRARELGLESRVEFLGAISPRDRLLSHARRSDVGIAFMPMHSTDVNMQHMTGASNKPFDYLACGCPLLVSELSDWSEMFVQPGYGIACNPQSAPSIAAAIRWYWDHRDEARAMGARGRQFIVNHCNYDTAFGPVKAVINDAAGVATTN